MEVMTSQELLRQHMTDSAIEKTLRGSDRKQKKTDGYENCPQCDKQVKSSGLTLHLQTHIKENLYHCDHCELQFKTRKYLARHVANMHSKKKLKLKCSYCEKMFKYKDSLRQHEMIHTGEKPHKCDVCGKTFRAHYSLKTHILIHTDEKPYACAFCDYKCRDSSTLRKHQERHLGSVERFHCKLCTKSYRSKAALKVHIAQDHLNLTETKMECHICKKKCRDQKSLTSHIKRVHERLSQVECDICNKTMHSGNLKAHLRTHCHVRAYKCEYPRCGKRFKTKGDMKKHSVIHYPSQHKTCIECGRVFTRTCRYKRHVRQGHQPRKKTEKCTVCKVKFYTRNHLLKHMHMKHSAKKKQFACAHCDFTTVIKPSLIGHLKAHQHDFDRDCKICRKKFKTYETLKSHYLLTHNIVYKPERFTKTKKKSIRPKMLDPNELKVLRDKTENCLKADVVVKLEPLDEISDDVPLSNLKNQLKTEEIVTGTDEPILMNRAQKELAKRITERVKEFKKVDGFDEFVDKRILDKNTDFRTKTTNPGKEINYLKIASEKDVNRLLRKARKRKQIEADESEKSLMDRMKRIYNERLLEAARKREKPDTKQFNKVLKVKLQRDPILESYYHSNNNINNNREENITENNNLNNVNETDTSSFENDIVVTNDTARSIDKISILNYITVNYDTPSVDNHDKDMIQSEIINDKSFDDDSENIIKSSVIEKPNNKSNDTFTVQYNTKSNKDKIICQNIENKSKTDIILETECIKIIKTVSLSLLKGDRTHKASKNDDTENIGVNNTDLTLLCNNIDSNTNTSYLDISNSNDHRIVQEKSAPNTNADQKKDKNGPVLDVLSHNQDNINKIPNHEVKPNASNIDSFKNKTNNSDATLIENYNLNKLSLVSINKAPLSENDTDTFIKEEEYSENDIITFDNDDLAMSLTDLEDCVFKSENHNFSAENSLNVSATECYKNLSVHNKKVRTKDLQNDDSTKVYNIEAEVDNIMPEADNVISDGEYTMSKSDRTMSQITKTLSENDKPFAKRGHNLEIENVDLNTHNNALRISDYSENNIQKCYNSNSSKGGRVSKNKRREIVNERPITDNNNPDLEREKNNSVNENHDLDSEKNDENHDYSDNVNENHDLDSENNDDNYDLGSESNDQNHDLDSENIDQNDDLDSENNDLVNENDDLETDNKDINEASTSNTNSAKDISQYKKLNSKKINFNTSQCYVCFKLFQTKEELMEHCKQHFGVCNENRLKKCPLCSFVGREYLRKHLFIKHNIDIDQGKYNTIETNEVGTFTIKVAQKPTDNDIEVRNIEIIPSIKQLNKQAYQKIDEQNRINKKTNIVKRKLVKKGTEWIIETEIVKLNYLDYLLPIGKDSNSINTEAIDFDYLELLSKLSNDVKKEGRTIVFPCDRCDLICTNMAALKAHRKSHDKIKTGKRKPKKPKATEKPLKINKNNNKNNDPKLIEFFEQNVKGVDSNDFEQFSQIYKVIDRLSDDKLALAASNKEYGLNNTPDGPVNLVENKSNNRIRKKHSINKSSGYKKGNFNEEFKAKRKVMQAKLRSKIIRNK